MKRNSSKRKVALLAVASLLTLAGCDIDVPSYGGASNEPTVGENGNWWIAGSDTGISVKGEDGKTPYIGSNGNWWIGDTDTGVKAQGEKGDTGSQGPKGDTGSQGPKGDPGTNGQDGTNGKDGADGKDGVDGHDGADGTSLLTGNGIPASSLGKDGDSYINLDNYDFYVKADGAWTKKGNIKGADGAKGADGVDGQNGQDGTNGTDGAKGDKGDKGADGSSLLTGSGAPDSSLGKDGDSYIDLLTFDYYVKSDSSWNKVGNIKGADGAKGADGTNGTNGADGAKGDKGEDGQDGAKGDKGEDGKDGATVLTGNGAPDSSLGNDGDTYIDLDNYDFYLKAEGSWDKKGNIKGQDGKTPYIGSNGNWWIGDSDTGVKAQGAAGATTIGNDGASVLTGVGAPGTSVGKDGDSYIDTDSFNFYVKVSGARVLKGNIKGADGAKGADGTNGTDGAKGEDGQDGAKGDKGDAGQDGTSVRTGAGVPATDLGVNGDSYIDTETFNFYVKEGGVWVLKGNIKGADGAKGADGTNGTNGTDGAKGDKGEDGQDGAKGDKGDAGKDGSSVLFGAGAPAETLGNDGDSYIDTDTFDFYTKASGAWVKVGSLKGADGAAGKDGTNGTDGTDGQKGADGKDGNTPFIGDNGNWWIGTTDTGVYAGNKDGYQLTFDVNGGVLDASVPNPMTVKEHKYATLPTPTKDGRTFLGWYTGFGPNDGRLTNITPIEADLSLVAEWNKYTVTWLNGDGTTLESKELNAGEIPSDPVTVPVKAETDDYKYTFQQWDVEYSPVHKDLTISPIFNEIAINKYTVTWLNADGSTFASTTVKEGEKAVAPEGTPTKDNDADGTSYKFMGWDYDDSVITGNISIQPTFEAIAEVVSITLSKESGNHEVGDNVDIESLADIVTHGSAQDLTALNYESDNTDVATISSSGQAKIVGVGVAHITVSSDYDSSKSATYTITATWPTMTTYTFGDHYEDTVDFVGNTDAGSFSIAWDKGTATTAPRYWAKDKSARVYSGGSFTVSSTQKIYKVVLNFVDAKGGLGDGATAVGADNAGLYVANGATAEWRGESTSVTFNAKQACQILSIEVYFEKQEVALESITLDKTTLSLSVGDSETLTAALAPVDYTGDTTITWTSDKEDIATVVNGVVTGVADGTAIITATCGDKSASCTVTVSTPTSELESISLDKTTLEMTVDEMATLTVSFNPTNYVGDKTVTWESSDEDVVLVDDGTLLAGKEGTATITATCNGKSATCTVTVAAKPAEAISYNLTFNKDNNQEKVSAYTTSWTNISDGITYNIVNFNNNSNGAGAENKDAAWTYIKCGNKSAASVAYISTASAFENKIGSISIEFGKISNADKLNSAKVIVATDADFSNTVETIDITSSVKSSNNKALDVSITTPTAGCYYKIVFDIAKVTSSGFIQINSVTFTEAL